jgi:hypothetical protein
MKKRILVLLTVVALMVVMLAIAVGPAFAQEPASAAPFPPKSSLLTYQCTGAEGQIFTTQQQAMLINNHPESGWTCEKLPK